MVQLFLDGNATSIVAGKRQNCIKLEVTHQRCNLMRSDTELQPVRGTRCRANGWPRKVRFKRVARHENCSDPSAPLMMEVLASLLDSML
jgi:hypothetical protein